MATFTLVLHAVNKAWDQAGRAITDVNNQVNAEIHREQHQAGTVFGLSTPAVTAPTLPIGPIVGGNTNPNLNNLGRAALIFTSLQGVEGTTPTNRYSLLGNSGIGIGGF